MQCNVTHISMLSIYTQSRNMSMLSLNCGYYKVKVKVLANFYFIVK